MYLGIWMFFFKASFDFNDFDFDLKESNLATQCYGSLSNMKHAFDNFT